MINIFVWSKDRACQLDVLLRSIRLYIPARVNILYKASTKEFQRGYEKCKHYHTFYSFYEENNFREDSIRFIEETCPGNVCFCTDDMVFFKSVPSLETIKKYLNNQSVFSFRLGYNTVIQDHLAGNRQPALVPERIQDELLFWNPNHYPWTNYGYTHALDTHMYKTDYIVSLMREVEFTTTNQLEGVLQKFNSKIKTLYSPKESVAVNIPMNNMSGLTGINKNNMSLEEVNQRYLDGQILKFIFNEPIVGCHQDVKFKFFGEK